VNEQDAEWSRSAKSLPPVIVRPCQPPKPKSRNARYVTVGDSQLEKPTLTADRSVVQFDWFGNVLLISVQSDDHTVSAPGSISSGNRAPGSVSSARSGVTTSCSPASRAGIVTRRAGAGSRRARPRPAGAPAGAAGLSHIAGGSAANTSRPLASRARNAPPSSAARTPPVTSPNRSSRSAGWAAAARSETTSTSR
jgi:hypothetical protein